MLKQGVRLFVEMRVDDLLDLHSSHFDELHVDELFCSEHQLHQDEQKSEADEEDRNHTEGDTIPTVNCLGVHHESCNEDNDGCCEGARLQVIQLRNVSCERLRRQMHREGDDDHQDAHEALENGTETVSEHRDGGDHCLAQHNDHFPVVSVVGFVEEPECLDEAFPVESALVAPEDDEDPHGKPKGDGEKERKDKDSDEQGMESLVALDTCVFFPDVAMPVCSLPVVADVRTGEEAQQVLCHADVDEVVDGQERQQNPLTAVAGEQRGGLSHDSC